MSKDQHEESQATDPDSSTGSDLGSPPDPLAVMKRALDSGWRPTPEPDEAKGILSRLRRRLDDEESAGESSPEIPAARASQASEAATARSPRPSPPNDVDFESLEPLEDFADVADSDAATEVSPGDLLGRWSTNRAPTTKPPQVEREGLTARLAELAANRRQDGAQTQPEDDPTETERLEAERLDAERSDAERLEAERLEAERLEAERQEAERLEAERLEAERLEAERLEAERLEAERLEAERLEAERQEAERQEAERQEAERQEAERLEAERLEAERLEAERLEAERLEAERLEAERLEAERQEAETPTDSAELTDASSEAEDAYDSEDAEDDGEWIYEYPDGTPATYEAWVAYQEEASEANHPDSSQTDDPGGSDEDMPATEITSDSSDSPTEDQLDVTEETPITAPNENQSRVPKESEHHTDLTATLRSQLGIGMAAGSGSTSPTKETGAPQPDTTDAPFELSQQDTSNTKPRLRDRLGLGRSAEEAEPSEDLGVREWLDSAVESDSLPPKEFAAETSVEAPEAAVETEVSEPAPFEPEEALPELDEPDSVDDEADNEIAEPEPSSPRPPGRLDSLREAAERRLGARHRAHEDLPVAPPAEATERADLDPSHRGAISRPPVRPGFPGKPTPEQSSDPAEPTLPAAEAEAAAAPPRIDPEELLAPSTPDVVDSTPTLPVNHWAELSADPLPEVGSVQEPAPVAGPPLNERRMSASKPLPQLPPENSAPDFVEYPGNSKMRILLAVAFLGSALATVIGVFWALQARTPVAALLVVFACVTMLATWWGLLSWSPSVITIENGILEVSRAGNTESFDLTSRMLQIDSNEEPSSRKWTASITRTDGSQLVIDRNQVDAREFVDIVEYHQTLAWSSSAD